MRQLADRAVTKLALRDMLTLVGGAVQTSYFAGAHGRAVGVGDPYDLAPWQFGQVQGAPPVDPAQWIASDASIVWRAMNAAYQRVAAAIGRPELASFITTEMSGFPILSAKAGLTRVSQLVGTYHFHLDPDPAKSTAVFGPSAVLGWLAAGPGRYGATRPAIAGALVGGAIAGVVASAVLSEDG